MPTVEYEWTDKDQRSFERRVRSHLAAMLRGDERWNDEMFFACLDTSRPQLIAWAEGREA
jgi:hypothetical protein